MNCCDDYGNCNQGRDCPIRIMKQPIKTESRKTRAKRMAIEFLISCVIVALTIDGAMALAMAIHGVQV